MSPSSVCKIKRTYLTRQEARKCRKFVQQKFKRSFRIYKCDICELFHLTTKKKKEKK